jgi:succinoglycan biosynthesis protein ExoA
LNYPLVSVVIPIRNEEAFIERCLGAVLDQDYPQEKLEVLIADGMSDDATVNIIRRMDGADRVRIFENPDRIQAAGLNIVIPQAQGKYVIRVDGHTIIAPDYVRRCVELLEETGAHNVGGAMDPAGLTPMGKAIAAAGKSPFAVPSAFHVSSTPQYTDTVYLGAWPRVIFDHVGLYNTKVGVNEDYELNYRIRQSGGTIYFSPDIKSVYYGRQTLSALARQYFRYGKSKVKTLANHPKSLRPRQLIAPLFVAGLVLGPLLCLLFPALWPLWLAGIVFYGVAAIFFAVKTAAPLNVLWRIPIVFFVIHVCWGAGFWLGLFGFRTL